jgi:hypothetical protein
MDSQKRKPQQDSKNRTTRTGQPEWVSRGLLDRSTAQYFYQRLKTTLHKPRGNLLENLFSKKYAFKNNLQLLEKKFCLKQIYHLKMAFYLAKWPIFKNLQYFSN